MSVLHSSTLTQEQYVPLELWYTPTMIQPDTMMSHPGQ